MARDLNDEEHIWLEKTVDAAGLEAVVMALSELCGHISTVVAIECQDARLAKRYATIEGALGVLVPALKGL